MVAIVLSSEKLETVNTASANVTSLLITLPHPITKLNSDKFCFMYVLICVQGLNKFLKFFWSKFQPGDYSLLVLNFWANLSLGVLIKFVLIKKACTIREGWCTSLSIVFHHSILIQHWNKFMCHSSMMEFTLNNKYQELLLYFFLLLLFVFKTKTAAPYPVNTHKMKLICKIVFIWKCFKF